MLARRIAIAAVLVLAPLLSVAQEVEGKWNVSLVDQRFGLGAVSFVFVFEVDDEGDLVGSMENQFGSTPIEEGVIDGNEISFRLTLNFGQGPMTWAYNGTIEGNEIRMLTRQVSPPTGPEVIENVVTAIRAE